MRVTFAYLVVVDISGYTRFITGQTLALMHAEQIITDLISAVLDQSHDPMVLNKLEGDAALLYREQGRDDVEAAQDVFAQVRSFFPAFQRRAAELRTVRANCSCEACSNIASLCLKAFVHAGEIAIKRVRQFDELAGEPVILVHRLMKNTVPSREYVLVTYDAAALAQLPQEILQAHSEEVQGMGSHQLWIVDPSSFPLAAPSPIVKTSDRSHASHNAEFRHLPRLEGSFGVKALHKLKRWFVGRQ